MNDSATKKTTSISLLTRVFSFVRPYKIIFYSSILLTVIIAILAPIRPYLIQLTVNKSIGKPIQIASWLKPILFVHELTPVVQFIIVITAFQIGLIIFETLFRIGFTLLTAKLGQYVVKDLRVAVYNKILKLNLRYFDHTPIGTLTTRTINDIESINDIFSDGLVPIIFDLLTIFITLAAMLWIDWKLTFVSLIPFPIILIATYYFKDTVQKSFTKVRTTIANLNAFIQEHITGMQIVQSFSAEEKTLKEFKKINAEHRDANIKAIFAYSIFFPVVELVLAISIGLSVWWIAHKQLQAGVLVAFILYLNQIFRPLRVLADKFNVLQMGMIAAERVFKIMDTESSIVHRTLPANHAQLNASFIGALEFKQVSFAYNNDNYVLKNISFKVKPHETLAIVGHTGSGKTTITSLINRLYPLTKGEIFIDNKNITEYPIDILRKNIGVVLQDTFLFAGSVKDNITLRNETFNSEAGMQKVIDAAKSIDMHDFIMQLPGGYDYNVMERGNTLSYGQRQLLSFIRALLYNSSILILDEATASVDSETELLVEQSIEKLIKGRTTIIIAHRLSTIKKADSILVLDNGEIKEQGTHESLLALRGFYAKLYNSNLLIKHEPIPT